MQGENTRTGNRSEDSVDSGEYVVVYDVLFFLEKSIEDILLEAEQFAPGNKALQIQYLSEASNGRRLVKRGSREFIKLEASGLFGDSL